MLGFKKKAKGGAATAGLPEIRDEIRSLTDRNRAARDIDTERRILDLRHRAALELVGAGRRGEFPESSGVALAAADPLPELRRGDVTAELLRAGIMRDGCVLVRGLVDRDRALAFAQEIDRAFAERDGGQAAEGYYEEFVPQPPHETVLARDFVRAGGGLLAADAPKLSFQMHELFAEAGLPELVEAYLGEPPLLSAETTTLRKAPPDVPGAWHQDGAFMGDVRALNLWLSLSRCGDEAPGLDVVPRRVALLTDRGESIIGIDITQARAEEVAAEVGTRILRPIFEPGDALFFDDVFLHQTASDPAMPKPRYAIESWFFGSSAFPSDYVPVAV